MRYFGSMPAYNHLDALLITRTLEETCERIGERFPESNLRQLAQELIVVSREAAECVRYLTRPNWPLRIAGIILSVVMLALIVAGAGLTLREPSTMSIADIVQTVEAGVNDLIFFAIAVFFIMTVEVRMKRRRALVMLHQLRSLAHVVDMHQLTKDPERLMSRPASGEMDRPRFTTGVDLAKYLDFCSELLSLISKIAALQVQDFNDGVVLAGVQEIEGLTTALSGKIWQKITILERSTASRRV